GGLFRHAADEPRRARRRLAGLPTRALPAQRDARRRGARRARVPDRSHGISRLGTHPVRGARGICGETRGDREAAGPHAARRHPCRGMAPVRRAQDRAALFRPRRAAHRAQRVRSMTAIAAMPRPARSRFFLDRSEIVGPLFIAPAILYVVVLVGLPFLLALYYSVSAYNIFNPSYAFVGLKNFRDVLESEIFRRTLVNTLVFTISAQIIGLLLGKIGAMLLMQAFPGRGLACALIVVAWGVRVALAAVALVGVVDAIFGVMKCMLLALCMMDEC